MRKFTESLLFGVLFLFAVASWWIMDLTGQIPALNPKELAPMTVGIVVIIATPALLVLTILAFVRALTGTNPKPFWAWVTTSAALVAGALTLGRIITQIEGLQLGFSNGVWFSAVFALLGLTGFILALTGAIPTPIKLSPEEKKAAKKAQKREKAEAKKAAKAEEKEQAKVERALAKQAEADQIAAQQAAQIESSEPESTAWVEEAETGGPQGFDVDLLDEDALTASAPSGAAEEAVFETGSVEEVEAGEADASGGASQGQASDGQSWEDGAPRN